MPDAKPALLVLLAFAAACAVNPATGEREFSLMSEAQEIAIGQEMDPQITAEMGLYEDPELQRYVSTIGTQLAASSERPNLPWKFTVVDSPAINAFAIPGGFIYLTRGIMPFLQDEAQLAGVLGHEIGHVTARHSAQQYSRATGAQLGLLLGGIFVPAVQQFGGLAQTGLGLLFLKYGRDDELQADSLGTRYTARNNWNPAGVAGMLNTLDRIGAVSDEERQRVPNWLATHPPPVDRVERVQAAIEAARAEFPNAQVEDREEFLRHIDGLIFGDNPDQGIMRGRQFLHTGLRFALDFPEDWPVQNSASQVISRHPDANVFLLLQLVQQPVGRDIQAVALNNMQQAGFRVLDGDRTSVNGLTAFVGTYQGVLEDLGEVIVRAIHLEHRDRIFLIAGLAPVQIFSRVEDELMRSLRSFRSLSAAQAEAIRPNRIDFYTVRSGDTWESIAERNAKGAVRPAALAVMNGLSASEPPPVGQRVKIVVAG
jgi:predicted Zn-dependent protease